MNTHECYVSLEIAKLLKQAGFDWEVNHSYLDCESLDNSCSGYMEDLPFYHNLNDGKYGGMSAPTLEVAQRWLREVKRVFITVSVYAVKEQELTDTDKFSFYIETWNKKRARWEQLAEIDDFNTYEEAQEAGIKEALEVIL